MYARIGYAPAISTYLAWASALLILTVMGNAKASKRGNELMSVAHAFSYDVIPQS